MYNIKTLRVYNAIIDFGLQNMKLIKNHKMHIYSFICVFI